MSKKVNAGDRAFDLGIYLIMLFVLVITLYPFYYVIIISFNNGIDTLKGGIYLFPRKFSLDNYQNFFTDAKWVNAFYISILRTVIGTTAGIFFTCLIAYALSFKDLAFRKVYVTILVFSMYFSGGIIPYYVLIKQLGLVNKFAVYIVPGLLSTFFVLIAISFFREIPQELIESTRIDGGNDLVIFLKIIIPISTPLMATIGLFLGVGQWNSWFDSAFFIQKDSLRTLSYLLMQIINKSQIGLNASLQEMGYRSSTTTPRSIQMTAMVIAVIPIICVYPFLQKYFIKGMMIGSVKG